MKNTERNRNLYSKLIVFMNHNQVLQTINNFRDLPILRGMTVLDVGPGFLFANNRGVGN